MTNFDERIKEEFKNENIVVPEEVHAKLEDTLQNLPEREVKTTKRHFKVVYRKALTIAASIAFALLVFMPNVSVAYAQAMSEIPVLGAIVHVFTIRNYLHEGEKQELVANIPNVNIENGTNTEDANDIYLEYDLNDAVDAFTSKIIDQFYADLALMESEEYCKAVNIDYEVVTNNFDWFTLRINVTETEASGYTYAKFYHISRTTGEIVTFADMIDSSNYPSLEEYIISDMKAQMEADKDIEYFFDNPEIGEDIVYVTDDQNFYFDENNNLVMVYNEYTVAPGFMGMPEITIPVEVYEPLMK